jgi:hypothetical protein
MEADSLLEIGVREPIVENKYSYKKKHRRPLSKKKEGGQNLSPMRNRKACHSISTAHWLKSV